MYDKKFTEIENKWKTKWEEEKVFLTKTDVNRPKYYVLDMFPYPSGSGLHVGHPLGYVATDIVARYKRLQGFNVLHPMGYDAFGLPAEQYAIQTGQHPAMTTENNINQYRKQLENLGFSFDWSREVRTCNPEYYRWTQWIFLKLYNSWYNKTTDKAEAIENLITEFSKNGNRNIHASCSESIASFSENDWGNFDESTKQKILLNYRLAFLQEATVNWCPMLGTVLANEEVKDGLSERGGYPVIKKQMRQWFLRITAYADRLLEGLERIEWPVAVKEMQKNWIGRSEGAMINFSFYKSEKKLTIFTTRPDTILGCTFMVVAPEHELLPEICNPVNKREVMDYIEYARNRSERERIAEVKNITGKFTGAFVVHPFSGEKIPVWVSDYVIFGYGTGAIMAVPAHDSRDHAFAKKFELPLVEVVSGGDVFKEAYEAKEGTLINSSFINGMSVTDAIHCVIIKAEEKNIGFRKINYKLRDAGFSRQRYWGEPFPVYYKNDIPYPLEEKELPLVLPEAESYQPTGTGEGPLFKVKDWIELPDGCHRDSNTMPGWAGSSWYFIRYKEASNKEAFVSPENEKYWGQVDLYMGGTEHATGHLLYARFWNKFLYDLGLVSHDEPFYKLINQGMIQGRSNPVYRIKGTNTFISYYLRKDYKTTPMHVDINIVNDDVLDIKEFRKWNPDFEKAEFILEDGKYFCGVEVEKMSKSRFNVVNPDDVIAKYGADTFRLYEMFLGPIEQSKPWNTHGIEGVFRFLKKVWRLFYDENENWIVVNDTPTEQELKTIHKTIKKTREDIERYSFNTCVSNFMICVNELTDLKCYKKEILEKFAILLSPFAPFISEELWSLLGNSQSVIYAKFPEWEGKYITESFFEYPVSVNGKVRTKINLSLSLSEKEIEERVLTAEELKKWLNGTPVKKVIVVKGRIVNVVV